MIYLTSLTALDYFYILGTICSIVAASAGLVKFANNRRKETLQRQLEARDLLEQKLHALSSVGTSVSARSDLAMFVQIELSSFYDDLQHLRHSKLRSFLLCAFAPTLIVLHLIYTAVTMLHVMEPNTSQNFGATLFWLGGLAEIVFILSYHLADRSLQKQKEFIQDYERRIKTIWSKPIEKRLNSKNAVGPEEAEQQS